MASLKKAVEAKCKDCTYDKLCPGTWREQVEQCNIRSCALWPVRPMSVATIILKRKERNENDIDIDALVAGLPDDEEVEDPVA